MSTKLKVIISAVVVLASFAFGRYSAPVKIKTVTQTVTVHDKTDDTNTVDNDNKKVTIVTITKPDGTKTTTTTITDNNKSDTNSVSTDDSSTSTTTSKEVTKSSSLTNLSFLTAESLSSPGKPMYGASINRSVLGPVTIGVFGFDNATIGASIGLSF